MRFTLENKTELINLNGYKPKLILPKNNNLGYLDKKVNNLVECLKDRNFKVKGIDVSFALKGIGPNKSIIIDEIRSKDFRIILNENGFQKILIPKLMFQKIEITTFGNQTLIILYKYAGKNWKKDKREFFEDVIKNNSKKNGFKKTYVIYDTLYTGLNDVLYHNNYSGNEYSLNPKDKKYYNYSDIEKEIDSYLDMIIDFLNTYTKKEFFNLNIFEQPLPVKLNNNFIKGDLYTYINEEEYKRLHYIKSDIIGIEDTVINYGLIPTLRLVPINTIVPKDANTMIFDGFIWGEYFDKVPEKPKHIDDIFYTNYIPIKLNLYNFANVFIVDRYVEEQTRSKLYSKYKSPKNIPKEEYDNINYSLASTLVHINDYKGDYIKPVILIKRELHPDEISI